MINFDVKGIDALLRELEAVALEEGPKSINKALRKTTRKAMQDFVLPEAQARLSRHSPSQLAESSRHKFGGQPLIDQLKVRAIKRSRSQLGHTVGLDGELFVGDSFYAGFLEFGTEQMPADSFLRDPLYQAESTIIRRVQDEARKFIDQRNRATK